ncbi:asparagine synthase-related protein [Candidatus Odyssella thessalonicensis]|uniref:asparagine synthase-related protein n=1 Tax=Candidatus Odyssella thessalonicensis TaxID=84647 RepID=UPI000225B48C|nr:asparagine synthase-related protein [Candidatus Odyssella thessalonicensis]
MIYLGFWSQQNAEGKGSELISILQQHIDDQPSCMVKKNLTLVYGKQHIEQDTDQVWESDSAVLIGRIFERDHCAIITSQEFGVLSQELKQDLPQKMWGKYVYWYIDVANKLNVMVDPTGQLSCFYYALPGGDLIFSSHIELIQQYISSPLERNWHYLCSYLFYGNSSAIQTSFKGVEEVPPGCSLTATPYSRAIQPFWNPFATHSSMMLTSTDAVDVLQSVLKPLIEPYKNVCVSLSGGLDSTALVFCLSKIVRPDQKLSAFNYFDSTIQSSNELTYARKVCEEVGINLTEIDTSQVLPFDPYVVDQGLKINKPFSGCISAALINEVSHYLPSRDSCILLSGHGSDHIFMRPPTRKCIADYWLTHGTKGLLDKVKEVTHFYRDSLTPILVQNMVNLANYLAARKPKKRENPQDKSPYWFNHQINRHRTSEFIHPAYQDISSRILPGKYDQIDALFEGLASVQVRANTCYLEQYPFFCEPVVNFALSFPTYDLFQKGYDRYPLRHSVNTRFKTDTVWRRDKCQTTGTLQLGVKRNIEFVMELCLEGEMVKQGFVDKDGLYHTISLISNGDNIHLWPFIQICSIEMFLKIWSDKLI